MALPKGSHPNKNGKRVYSQSARAVKHRQENKIGEFAEDHAAAASTTQPPGHAGALETPPELISSPGGFSTEAIGVTTTATIVAPEVPLAPHTEDQPNYFCENCKGKISLIDTECPTCEETMDWSGLT